MRSGRTRTSPYRPGAPTQGTNPTPPLGLPRIPGTDRPPADDPRARDPRPTRRPLGDPRIRRPGHPRPRPADARPSPAGHERNGLLVEIPFHSPLLGCRRTLAAWLPPGYTRSTRRYPVVVLLRGHHLEWQRLHRTHPGFSILGMPLATVDIRRVMGALVRSRRLPPVIVVMPCMSNDDGTLAGLATDWIGRHHVHGRALRGVGTGLFGRHMVEEILPLVDRRFRTLADPAFRALDGFSLGGFTALSLALRHPERFAAVGAYDGSFLYLRRRHDPLHHRDRLLDHRIFDPVFDRPRLFEHIRHHSPAWLVAHGDAEAMRHLVFHLQSGPERAEPMDSNYHRAVHLVRLLKRRGLHNAAHPAVLDHGHHDWPTAFEHLAMALEAFARLLPGWSPGRCEESRGMRPIEGA